MKSWLCFAFVLLPAMASQAQEAAPAPEFSFEGIRFFGADAGLRLGDWKVTGGAGWETLSLGRDASTGLPLEVSPDPKVKTYQEFPFPNASATLGWVTKKGDFDLWANLGGFVHGNAGNGAPATGAFGDLDGNTLAYLQAGVRQDGLKEVGHGLKAGGVWELSGEWGPSWANVRGGNFNKLRVLTSAQLVLWDLDAPRSLLTGTLALRGNARWGDGTPIPVSMLESTEIRGYSRLLETQFRSVGSIELRVGLPSLGWLLDFKPLIDEVDLVPVVLVFAEGGWYRGYANAPSQAADRSGLLASVGAGAGISVFGVVTPTLQWALPLSDGETVGRLHFFFSHRF